MRPNRGTVRLLGTDLPGDHNLRRRLGVVGHEPFVYGDLTATENLNYYARLYRLPRDGRVATALETVELEAAADRPVRGYSRGMLQRLAIARAVLHEPDVLLLDEPFTGLDPRGAGLLVGILGEVRRRAVTVVLTTHDFERGLHVADRAALLHHGRVAWESGQALPDLREMHDIYNATIGAEQG